MNAVSVVFALLFAVVLASGCGDDDDPTPAPSNGGTPVLRACSAVTAHEIARPAVVRITFELQGRLAASGTGFVFREGSVMTNMHVVEGSDEVDLHFYDGRVETVDTQDISGESRLVGDIAVIPVGTGEITPLRTASAEPKVLEDVVAIGFPGDGVFGTIDSTATKGVVSSVFSYGGVRYIKTDAALIPGNSGGPLLNTCGEVVGVAVQRALTPTGADVEGSNYAIAIGYAQEVVARVDQGEGEPVPGPDDESDTWAAEFGLGLALAAANLSEADLPVGLILAAHDVVGGDQLPPDTLEECRSALGSLFLFDNLRQVDVFGAQPVLVHSGVFMLFGETDSSACFNSAVDLLSTPAGVSVYTTNLLGISSNVHAVEPLRSPGVTANESAFAVDVELIYTDGTKRTNAAVYAFHDGPAVGVVVIYFPGDISGDSVQALAAATVDNVGEFLSATGAPLSIQRYADALSAADDVGSAKLDEVEIRYPSLPDATAIAGYYGERLRILDEYTDTLALIASPIEMRAEHNDLVVAAYKLTFAHRDLVRLIAYDQLSSEGFEQFQNNMANGVAEFRSACAEVQEVMKENESSIDLRCGG